MIRRLRNMNQQLKGGVTNQIQTNMENPRRDVEITKELGFLRVDKVRYMEGIYEF